MTELYQLALAFAPTHLGTLWLLYKLLFLGFVITAASLSVYSAYKRDKLSGFVLFGLAWPLLALAYAADVLIQYTLACLVFTGWPRPGEYTVSRRLDRLLREEGVATPRGRRAIKLARFILVFDPNGHTFGGRVAP